MSDLFDMEPTLSPRLKWMENNGIKLLHTPTDSLEWSAVKWVEIDNGVRKAVLGYGESEEEACFDICEKLDITSWKGGQP